MKTFSFCGKRFEIILERLDGVVTDKPCLILPDGLAGDRKTLEALIHEALHACVYELEEKVVERTAHDVARFLWALNYRRRKDLGDDSERA